MHRAGAGMGAGVQAANVFDQLNGGPTAYTTTATHVPTGCVSGQVSIPVANVQDLPDLVTANTASTNCVVGKEDGRARVVTVDLAAATTVGFTYAWTGPVAPLFDVSANATNNDIELQNVQGGAGYDYTVLVTNQSNGCQSSVAVNVADAKVLPLLTLTPAPTTICDPLKAGIPFDGQVGAAVDNIPGGSTVNDYFFCF